MTRRENYSRRNFLGSAVAATAAVSVFGLFDGRADAQGAATNAPAASEFKRKLKLGVIGLGGRGKWIAKHFAEHGGCELHAVADYFPEVAEKAGDLLGVDSSRCFSTLSGYKRLIESGVEAVVLETPPFFFPEHAMAAVEAGLHVYCAKPVAVDVPGCLTIAAAAKQSTAKQRVFFVDYQLPTDPANNEVLRRVRDSESGFGKIRQVSTVGTCKHLPDPIKTANIESRLQHLVWVNDIVLGADYIGNFDIHAIDAALWALGERPVAASGCSSIGRVDPHGDSHDICLVTFEYASGVLHDHRGSALNNFAAKELSCRLSGQTGNALLNYWEKATFRSGEDGYSGVVENLYEAGVVRNVATFYRHVTEGQVDNLTVPRAVDGALTCVLGKEAAARRGRLTMESLLKENKKLPVDLTGLRT